MNRLMWAVAAMAVTGGVVSAQLLATAGKERTLLEQEFYAVEPPRSVVSPKGLRRKPQLPAVSPSVLSDMRLWVVNTTAGRLGVSPLVRPEIW